MELKEYIQIIKKHFQLFISTVIIIILASFAYFFFRPVSFATSLTLNITRSGSQDTSEYKYDDFYRLQADEKFAETLVQWLGSPRVVEDIYKEAGINTQNRTLRQLGKSIKAEKMSSQVVAVNFSSKDNKTAQNIAGAISKVISKNIKDLNKEQSEKTWFEVIFENPVTKVDKISLLAILAVISFAVFAAFWVVMIRHYTK